jgi:hypothetical protein
VKFAQVSPTEHKANDALSGGRVTFNLYRAVTLKVADYWLGDRPRPPRQDWAATPEQRDRRGPGLPSRMQPVRRVGNRRPYRPIAGHLVWRAEKSLAELQRLC